MKRRDALKMGGIAVSVSLAGCTGNNSNSNGSGQSSGNNTASGGGAKTTTKMENVSLSYAGATSGALGVVTDVLLDQEFAAKYNLDLKTDTMSIPSAQKAIVNKHYDVGPVPPLTAADLSARGNPLRSVFPLCEIQESVIAKAEMEASSLADLKGAKLGSLPQSSSLYQIFEMITKMKGLSPDDYQYQFGSLPVLIGLLFKGEFDASLMVDPVTSRLLAADKYKEVVSYSGTWKNLTGHTIPVIDIGCWQHTVEEKPRALKSLTKAFGDAGAYITKNPNEVFSKFSDKLNLKEGNAQKLAAKRMGNLYPSKFSTDLRAGEKDMVNRAAKMGVLEKKPDVNSVFVDPGTL